MTFTLLALTYPQIDIILNSATGVELLLRDDLLNKIYGYPPFSNSVVDESVAQFVNLIRSAYRAGKRVVRVLEVGAGSGRLTNLLGQALVDANLGEAYYVDYVATDPSIQVAQAAATNSPWPTITPMALDLSIPPEKQNIDLASFDIVVAFNVLHGTVYFQKTLASLREFLLPGGHLSVVDFDGSAFATGVTGTKCKRNTCNI
jgi:fatty acid synthase